MTPVTDPMLPATVVELDTASQGYQDATEPMLPGTVVELVEVAAENLRLVASEMGTWPRGTPYRLRRIERALKLAKACQTLASNVRLDHHLPVPEDQVGMP